MSSMVTNAMCRVFLLACRLRRRGEGENVGETPNPLQGRLPLDPAWKNLHTGVTNAMREFSWPATCGGVGERENVGETPNPLQGRLPLDPAWNNLHVQISLLRRLRRLLKKREFCGDTWVLPVTGDPRAPAGDWHPLHPLLNSYPLFYSRADGARERRV